MSAEAQQVVALLDDVKFQHSPQKRSQSAAEGWKFGTPGNNLGGRKPFTAASRGDNTSQMNLTQTPLISGQKGRLILNKLPTNLIKH
jgi:hypothetical protein